MLEKLVSDAQCQMMMKLMPMIMHDISSPLYNIRNSCHMMEFHLERDRSNKADLHKYVEDILQSVASCIEKTNAARSLQVFARQSKREFVSASRIAEGIRGLITRLPMQLSRQIEYSADAFADGLDVNAYVNEVSIYNCMLNLLINASTFSTPHHTVRVECKLLAEELVISVTNSFAGDPDTSPEEWMTIGHTTKGTATGYGLKIVNSICVSEGYQFSLDYRRVGQGQNGEVIATIRIEGKPNEKSPVD